MKVDKSIRSNLSHVDAYIEELENELCKKDTLAIHRLIHAANKISIVLANDLDLISSERASEAKILSDDKESKTLERVMLLLKSVETFKSLSDIADSMLPEIIEALNKENEIKKAKVFIDTNANPFEQIQKEILEKSKKK